MKNWTIGKRIIFGFTALVLLTIALGSLAVFNMRSTGAEAKQLSDLKVPEVRVANEIERSVHLTMYQIRAYADTEETNFLQAGLIYLADMKKHISEAKELGAKSPLLADLKASAEQAEIKAAIYEKQIQLNVAKTEGIQQNRKELDVAGEAFQSSCNLYLTAMKERMAAQIQTNASVETLLNRHKKITLIGEVAAVGDTVQIAAWRALATRNPEQLLDAQKDFTVIKSKLDELRPITTQAADIKEIDDCQAAADAYKKAMNDLIAGWQSRDEATKIRFATATDLLKDAQNTSQDGLSDTTASAGRSAKLLSSATIKVTGGLIAAIIFAFVLGFIITRGTNRVLNRVASNLADGSNQVASAAGQISGSSQSLAEGASEQAASLEETSSSLEEMASMTKRNSENAQKANELAKEARSAADKGVGDMQAMSSAMEAIKTSSDDIAKIIKTIDEIAFQTNILALNAAVEAARAGEAGMGFAVVAEEVRNLAQRSALAAKETAGKIEGAITKTGQGVEISSKVAETLNQIVAKVRQVDELVAEVAGASREQTQGIGQINTAVGQMDKVTQSNAANAEESAAAAEELNAQAATMKQSVIELLQLVGGSSQSPVVSRAPITSRSNGSRLSSAPAKRASTPRGNGHAHPAPAMASPANGRKEIPMEGDFKDF